MMTRVTMTTHNRAVILPMTLLFLALQLAQSGCIKRTSSSNRSASKAVIGPPLTDEECNKFAVDLEKALSSGNATTAYRMVDWEAILETSMEGVEAPESIKTSYVRGFKSAGTRPTGIMGALVESLKTGASYDLLRVHDEDQEKHVLFRLINPNDSVNYHDWILARRPNGGVQAVDLHNLASGERITESHRRLFLSTIPDEKGLLSNLAGGEREFIKNFPKIKQMTGLTKNKKYQEALGIYHQLPPSLKTDKNLLLIRVNLAQNVGGEEYFSAMEDIMTNYPEEPFADFLAIDLYIVKENFAKAIESINRLDRSIGGDAYLKVLCANISIKSGNWAEARKAIQNAITEEPSLKKAYWVLVEISLHEKRFDETVEVLNLIEDKFHEEIGDLTSIAVYGEFVRSPQYEKWLKSREKK